MTVTGYDVSLFLHITPVVIGLGSTFVEGLTFPVAMRLDPRHLPYQVAELDAGLGDSGSAGRLRSCSC